MDGVITWKRLDGLEWVLEDFGQNAEDWFAVSEALSGQDFYCYMLSYDPFIRRWEVAKTDRQLMNDENRKRVFRTLGAAKRFCQVRENKCWLEIMEWG